MTINNPDAVKAVLRGRDEGFRFETIYQYTGVNTGETHYAVFNGVKGETMTQETAAELVARHKRVEAKYAEARKAADRALAKGKCDTQKSLWAGCLHFTLLQIESEMEDRGLR